MIHNSENKNTILCCRVVFFLLSFSFLILRLNVNQTNGWEKVARFVATRGLRQAAVGAKCDGRLKSSTQYMNAHFVLVQRLVVLLWVSPNITHIQQYKYRSTLHWSVMTYEVCLCSQQVGRPADQSPKNLPLGAVWREETEAGGEREREREGGASGCGG